MIRKFIFTVLLGLFISSNSFAGGHEMPKFDLSKFRPDFRIGILGGEMPLIKLDYNNALQIMQPNL